MRLPASFPARLQFLIDHARSQKEVARLAEVSDGTLINWRRGRGVRASKLRTVARLFGVSLEWLREGVGDEEAELAAFCAKLHDMPIGPPFDPPAGAGRLGAALARYARCLVGILEPLESDDLPASPHLFDALCRALLLLAREDARRRAVEVRCHPCAKAKIRRSLARPAPPPKETANGRP